MNQAPQPGRLIEQALAQPINDENGDDSTYRAERPAGQLRGTEETNPALEDQGMQGSPGPVDLTEQQDQCGRIGGLAPAAS